MKSFKELRNEAIRRDTYWIDSAALSFLVQIEERMQEQGMSKSDLAKRIGSSKAYLSKIFSGSPNFTVATMVRLARALGANVEIRIAPATGEAAESRTDVLNVAYAEYRSVAAAVVAPAETRADEATKLIAAETDWAVAA